MIHNQETDILGDQWRARLRREHERHAGIPDYGYCAARGPRPDVAPITSVMLEAQRELFRRHPRAAWYIATRYPTQGPLVHGVQFPRGYTRAAAEYEYHSRLADAATTRTDTGTADG